MIVCSATDKMKQIVQPTYFLDGRYQLKQLAQKCEGFKLYVDYIHGMY